MPVDKGHPVHVQCTHAAAVNLNQIFRSKVKLQQTYVWKPCQWPIFLLKNALGRILTLNIVSRSEVKVISDLIKTPLLTLANNLHSDCRKRMSCDLDKVLRSKVITDLLEVQVWTIISIPLVHHFSNFTTRMPVKHVGSF